MVAPIRLAEGIDPTRLLSESADFFMCYLGG
jgi:hypothetical protein